METTSPTEERILTPEERAAPGQEINRKRRGVYVFGTTIIFTLIAAAVVFLGYDGILAGKLIDGMLELLGVVIMFYLSTSTIDRSEILTNLGKGFASGFRSNGKAVEIVRPSDLKGGADVRGSDGPVG